MDLGAERHYLSSSMTVITFRKWDLERLVGVSFTEEKLRELLNRMKGELEEIRRDEVKLEVTHDRPDMFSVEGVARAAKGLLDIELGLPRLEVRESAYRMIIDKVPHRPYVVTCVVRNVELDDEAIRQLMQLQEKLHQTYGRDRRLFAIGLYDAAKIKFPIRYTLMKLDDIRYRPLGSDKMLSGREVLSETEKGKLYGDLAVHDGSAPVILDSDGNVLVMVPVLNSEDYKITEDTRDVLIDVTGPQLKHVLDAAKVVMYNVLERSKSRCVLVPMLEGADYGDKLKELYTPQTLTVAPEDVNELAGIELSKRDIIHYLAMCRHDATELEDAIEVKVAPYRINVLHKVDLIEDILIAHGYDNIPRELPSQPVTGSILYTTRLVDSLRELLRGLGFSELLNYALTSKKLLSLAKTDSGLIELLNPRSELYNCIRTAIWPQLLETIRQNEKYVADGLKVFDLGEVAYVREGEVSCELHAALAVTGLEITLTDILVPVKTLLRQLGLSPRFRRSSLPGLIPERTASIVINETEVGYAGEVHPEVLTEMEIYYPVAVCELNLDRLARVLAGK